MNQSLENKDFVIKRKINNKTFILRLSKLGEKVLMKQKILLIILEKRLH